MEIKNFFPKGTEKLENRELSGLDAWVWQKISRPSEFNARAEIRKALVDDNSLGKTQETGMQIFRTWQYIEGNQENMFEGQILTKGGITIVPEKINDGWQISEKMGEKIKTMVKINNKGESWLTLNQELVQITDSSNYPRGSLKVFELLLGAYQSNRKLIKKQVF